jgi:hypothetical protein
MASLTTAVHGLPLQPEVGLGGVTLASRFTAPPRVTLSLPVGGWPPVDAQVTSASTETPCCADDTTTPHWTDAPTTTYAPPTTTPCCEDHTTTYAPPTTTHWTDATTTHETCAPPTTTTYAPPTTTPCCEDHTTTTYAPPTTTNSKAETTTETSAPPTTTPQWTDAPTWQTTVFQPRARTTLPPLVVFSARNEAAGAQNEALVALGSEHSAAAPVPVMLVLLAVIAGHMAL